MAKGKTKTAKTNRKSKTRQMAKSAAKTAIRAKVKDKGLNLSILAPSLTVNDVEQSFAWYCDVLGFVVKDRWVHEGVFVGGELRAGDVRLYLGQDDWKQGRDRVKGLGFRIYFETRQDIDRLAAGIKARGGTLASEPRDEWGMRSFNLEDPSGYKITISSAR